MTWVKIDDNFFTNPKVIDLPGQAKLLYLAALAYSSAQLTDGVISPRSLVILCATVEVDKSEVKHLVDAGLWEVDDKGWRIHDYHVYNPKAEDVKERRQQSLNQKSEAGIKGAAVRWGGKQSKDSVDDTFDSTANGTANSTVNGGANGTTIAPPQSESYSESESQSESQDSFGQNVNKQGAIKSCNPQECEPTRAELEEQFDLAGCNTRHVEAFMASYASVGWRKGPSSIPITDYRKLIKTYCNNQEQWERDNKAKQSPAKPVDLGSSAEQNADEIEARRRQRGMVSYATSAVVDRVSYANTAAFAGACP